MHLQSEHLTLRPATADDLDDLYRIYGDPATNTFNPAGPHADIAYSRRVLAGWLEHIESYGYGNWAISLRANPQRIIGFGGIRIVDYPDFTVNNLGYRFSPEAWGKGLATEFALLATDYAFNVLKLEDVVGIVRKNHLASQKVLLKCGLTLVREIDDVPGKEPSLMFRRLRG
ncbi:TPA: GNAT family N-acetyltransferase [Kluyvera ascorbata]|uniref:GNAT family N-acetyltransferase n=1 Tax=Kluyvera ascorbata TaxID=51288 RepID=UPI00289AFA0C|nr:GNAT family N-acetyltransferase [Kluyvera ascorbata]MEB6388311.1 GNAT family N-acetyltransferase [Kluyvera ascorbata]HED3064756.1 GNAT family N-acetyltransferase [Kluyvera ascorbata]